MKKLLITLIALGCLTWPRWGFAGSSVTGSAISHTAAAADFQEPVDLGEFDRVSFQVVYSTYSPSTTTFVDGVVSSGTLVVSSIAGLGSNYITIEGQTFTETTDWATASTASGTAKNIADAIEANTTLNAVLGATWTSGAHVNLTFDNPGNNQYSLYSSTAALAWAFPYMQYGLASDVDLDNDTISETAHGYTTGLAVLYSTAGTAVTGLTDQTTYYTILTSLDLYQLASSKANATAGTAIDLTATTGGGTYTMTPAPISFGTSSFKWQASNDNSNWTDVPSISSVTFSATAGNTIWDLGQYDYKWIRMNYVAPTFGGIVLDAYLHGKY